MRVLRLAQVAAEAEVLRLRHQAGRLAIRLVFGGLAMVLLFTALAFGHIAAWYWLVEYLAAYQTALVIGGVDLLFAAILGLLAMRSSPGPVEIEALAVRERALEDAARSLTLSALALQVFQALIPSRSRR